MLPKTAFRYFIILFLGQSLRLVAYASAATLNVQTLSPERGSSALYIKVIVIVLSLSLALLFIAKWVYQSRRYRQKNSDCENNWCGRSLRLQLDDKLFAPFPSNAPSEKGKSGLLVGLFGSPSWETRYSNIFQKVSEQISSKHTHLTATPLHHGSNYQFSISPRTKQSENYFVDRSDSHKISEFGMRKISERSGWESLAGLPPAITSNAYPLWSSEIGEEVRCAPTHRGAPASPITTRRISPKDLFRPSGLDSMSSDSTAIADRIAHCVVDFPECIFSGTASHHCDRSSLSNCGSMLEHSWSHATHAQRTSRTTSESKTVTPCGRSSNKSSQTTAVHTIQHEDEATVKLVQVGSIRWESPPGTTSLLQSTNSKSVQRCNESLSSVPNWMAPQSLSHSVVSANTTFINQINISAVDYSSLRPNVIAPRPSPSQKRSPKMGPSPLRTMVLPDGGNSGDKIRKKFSQSHEISEIFPRPDTRTSNGKLSGGHLIKPSNSRTKLSPKSFKERTRTQESESLLNLIQELVQETSAWDDSLFVDHKFRAMINDSKQQEVITVSLPKQQKRRRISSHRIRLSCIRSLEGIPEIEAEVSLGEDAVEHS